MHEVDLDRCSRQPKGMEKIQAVFKIGPDSIILTWTSRQLLSPMTMEKIIANEDKHNPSAKITITNEEDKDKLPRTRL